AKKIKSLTQAENLCLAGGVALNCVANGKLLRSGLFKNIFVQPASGDSGGSLGAAYLCYYKQMQGTRKVDEFSDQMQGAYLGNAYKNSEIQEALNQWGANYQYLEENTLLQKTAELLANNKVIGWFQGRMEFGPRALGGRSILGNPQSETMQSVMNLKIKNRESFRPFAPAVLAEDAAQWFDLNSSSPYMLIVAPIHANRRKTVNNEHNYSGIEKLKLTRSEIPAVTHVDFSARIQTVDGKHNMRFKKLISKFSTITGCPILINTSFNVRGEPIVESPTDAYRCFMRTEMDGLVIGNFLLIKSEQPEWQEKTDWRKEYALD
ncbi:carbamoyltransferase family protein, partial [Acinetobacter baumannii]